MIEREENGYLYDVLLGSRQRRYVRDMRQDL